MQDVADIKTKSLGYQEVESLLRASRNTVYSKTSQIPEKKKGSFEKRSMVEIARLVSSTPDQNKSDIGISEEADKAVDVAVSEGEAPLTPYEKAQRDGFLDQSSGRDQGEEITDKVVSSDEAAPILAEQETTNIDDEALAPMATDFDNVDDAEDETDGVFMPVDITANAISDSSASGLEDTLDENDAATGPNSDSYDEAYAAGRLSMQNEMQEELGSAFGALTALISAFKNSDSEAYDTIHKAIEDKIIALASERAGYAIEDNPEPFVEKISRFVQSIGEANRQMTIRLNPNDLSLIQDNLADHNLQPEYFIGDAKLQPGDVRIVSGAIEIQDILSKRVESPASKDKESLESIGRVINEFLSEPVAHMETPADSDDTITNIETVSDVSGADLTVAAENEAQIPADEADMDDA